MMKQFESATNMTDEIAALSCLVQWEIPEADIALKAFYEKWQSEALVMNKWLVAQACSKRPDVLTRVKALENDKGFDMKNPNKVRSLIGAFGQNLVRFHDKSGSGYQYVADKIIEINSFNPSIAARLASCYKFFARVDGGRKQLMRKELQGILDHKDLSKDVYEIISNTLSHS